jgi:predicted MFS family arabinose efflux permease
LAPTFTLALLTRVLAGVGAAMFSPTANGAAATLVAPEKRGFALSVVIAGLSGATALGSPLGAVIGGLGDWRWTMVFVSALAAASGLGVWTWLSHIPLPPMVTLKQRVAPVADPRVALTLACTMLFMSGQFTIYTYFTVVFGRVINGNTLLMGALLVLWGSCGTACNLLGGRLIDKVGNRKVIIAMLIVLAGVLVSLPWAGANLFTATIAIAIWGAVGWGLLAPQQHRLVTVAPHSAPVVLGLNTSCTFIGVTTAGVIGALGIQSIGGHYLGYIGAALVVVSIVIAELATWRINVANGAHPAESLASA